MRCKIVLAAVLALAAGCAEVESQPKTAAGAVLGGVAGGLIGAQIGHGSGQLAATAAGTLIGALAGGAIGRSLDRADRMYAEQTTHRALDQTPAGTTSSWRNPDSGHSGTVTPIRTYQTAEGQYCREFQQTISVGGRIEEANGTACRQPDGSWRIVQ